MPRSVDEVHECFGVSLHHFFDPPFLRCWGVRSRTTTSEPVKVLADEELSDDELDEDEESFYVLELDNKDENDDDYTINWADKIKNVTQRPLSKDDNSPDNESNQDALNNQFLSNYSIVDDNLQATLCFGRYSYSSVQNVQKCNFLQIQLYTQVQEENMPDDETVKHDGKYSQLDDNKPSYTLVNTIYNFYSQITQSLNSNTLDNIYSESMNSFRTLQQKSYQTFKLILTDLHSPLNLAKNTYQRTPIILNYMTRIFLKSRHIIDKSLQLINLKLPK